MAIKEISNIRKMNTGNAGRIYKIPVYKSSNEFEYKYKKIRDISNEISKIKRETDYIKDYGKAPPSMIDFSKRLKIY